MTVSRSISMPAHAIQISDATPRKADCTMCVALAGLVAAIVVVVLFVMDRSSFDGERVLAVFSVFVGTFLLSSVAISAFVVPPAAHPSVLLRGDAIWLQGSLHDFERLPLVDLVRAQSVPPAADERRHVVRLDFLRSDGHVRHVEFVPHARYRNGDGRQGGLTGHLLRMAESARTERDLRVAASIAPPESPGLLFDLTHALSSPGGDSRVDSGSGIGSAQPDPGDLRWLSESDGYMRYWYPIHWLAIPVSIMTVAMLVIPGWSSQGWAALAVSGILVGAQWAHFKQMSSGMVTGVWLDGDVIRYRGEHGSLHVALSDVYDIRFAWDRYYLGRKPVVVSFLGDRQTREIRFVPRSVFGFGWMPGADDVVDVLVRKIQRIRENGDRL